MDDRAYALTQKIVKEFPAPLPPKDVADRMNAIVAKYDKVLADRRLWRRHKRFRCKILRRTKEGTFMVSKAEVFEHLSKSYH